MIFAFVISIFDVLDIQEIYCAHENSAFSTESPHADNEHDDLDDSGIEYICVKNFLLPFEFMNLEIHRVVMAKCESYDVVCYYADRILPDFYRPPIAVL